MNRPVYVVLWAVVVDRPELRDRTYPKVRPGVVIPNRKSCATQREALSLREQLLTGEWDFCSEYVRDVEVVAANPLTGGVSGGRTVRQKVQRTSRENPFEDESKAKAREDADLEARARAYGWS